MTQERKHLLPALSDRVSDAQTITMSTFHARESARQANGRFGVQSHTEPDGLSLVSSFENKDQTVTVETSAYELDRMQDFDRPVLSRLSAVGTGYAGTAQRAAGDPSPVVRAGALNGWDLPAHSQRQLQRDREVHRVIAVISA